MTNLFNRKIFINAAVIAVVSVLTLSTNSSAQFGNLFKDSKNDQEKGNKSNNPFGSLLGGGKKSNGNPAGGLGGLFGGGKKSNGNPAGGLGGLLGSTVQQSINTTLGPVGSHVLGRELAAQVSGAYKIIPPGQDARYQYLSFIINLLQTSSRVPYNYKPAVIGIINDDEVVNAFAAPGGFVFVTTGLLNSVKSEDQLAYVLAHEISHVEIGHGVNAIRNAAGKKLVAQAFESFGSLGSLGGFFNGVFNGYGKELEMEADIRGAELAANAGYNVASGIKFLEELQKKSSGSKNYPSNRAQLVAQYLSKKGIKADFSKNESMRLIRFRKYTRKKNN